MKSRLPVISAALALAYWLVDGLMAAAAGGISPGRALLLDASGGLPLARIAASAFIIVSGIAGAWRFGRGTAAGAVQPAGRDGGSSLEDTLSRGHEELEAVFSNLAVLIAVLDRDFNFLQVNDSYASRAGYAPEALLGRNHFELFPHPGNERIFRQVVASGVPYHAVARPFSYPDAPDEVSYWDWTLSPLKRPDGAVYGLLLSLIDVTRRVEDQSKIAKLSRLYSVLSEANKAIARIKTRDELLEAICRIMVTTGGFRLAWIGVPDHGDEELVPIVHAGDDSGYLESIRISLTDPAHAGSPAVTSLRTGVPVTVSDIARDARFTPWAKPAAKRGYRSATSFPIHQGGEVFGVLAALSGEPEFFTEERVALMSDLSEDISFALEALEQEERRLAAEEALHRAHDELEVRVRQRTAELEQMNRQLESFSYSVSHDLRGPLRAINGFSAVLMEDCRETLGEEGRDALERIRNASNRMDCLMDGLLNLSRIARTELRPQKVDLASIASQVMGELREGEPERRVCFTCPPQMSAVADPELARVALRNLLGNAWKFTGREPQGHIELGVKEEAAGPVFFVRDNGAGFDMDIAHNLFRPFQRLHTPAEFPGTGIGLATVARIVEAHGGRIRAESAEGEGATFHFSFSPGTGLPVQAVGESVASA